MIILDFIKHLIQYNLLNIYIPMYLASSLIKIIFVLIAVAYYTAAERKVMGAIHRRRGPNVTGVWGLLQPLADGLKLVIKELIIPAQAIKRLFLFAPVIIFAFSLTAWIVIPGFLTTYDIPQIILRIWQFLSIWGIEQWAKSLLVLGLLYFSLLYSVGNACCRETYKTYTIPFRLVLALVILDFAINMLLGFIVLELGNPEWMLYALMIKCPISLSPVIFIIEAIWLYYYITRTYASDKK